MDGMTDWTTRKNGQTLCSFGILYFARPWAWNDLSLVSKDTFSPSSNIYLGIIILKRSKKTVYNFQCYERSLAQLTRANVPKVLCADLISVHPSNDSPHRNWVSNKGSAREEIRKDEVC